MSVCSGVNSVFEYHPLVVVSRQRYLPDSLCVNLMTIGSDDVHRTQLLVFCEQACRGGGSGHRVQRPVGYKDPDESNLRSNTLPLWGQADDWRRPYVSSISKER